MKKAIVLLIAGFILGSIFIGCDWNKDKLESNSNVVSNVEILGNKKYDDKNNVKVVDEDNFKIYIVGTFNDFSHKRGLLLKVDNGIDRGITVKLKNVTTDGKNEEAVYSKEKIGPHGDEIGTIVFKDDINFKTSSGDIVILDSKSGKELRKYNYNIRIIKDEQYRV